MSLIEGIRVSYNKRSLSNQKGVSGQCERFKVFLYIILSFTHWSLTPNWKDTNLSFYKTQIPSNRAINHFLQFFNFLPLYSESFLLLAARLSPQNFLMKWNPGLTFLGPPSVPPGIQRSRIDPQCILVTTEGYVKTFINRYYFLIWQSWLGMERHRTGQKNAQKCMLKLLCRFNSTAPCKSVLA